MAFLVAVETGKWRSGWTVASHVTILVALATSHLAFFGAFGGLVTFGIAVATSHRLARRTVFAEVTS